VSNLRSAPTHRAELVTQALLGTPLRILEHEDGWLRVQTPDRYIAWTEQQVLEEMTAFEIEQYLDSSVMIVKAHTYAYDQPKPEAAIVSDLVAGCILMAGDGKNGYLPVQYPDGRRGYIVQEYAKPLDQQPATTSFEQAAMQFYGTPYLWGGTSAKGMDCSGFTKNIYMLNGLMLPRDASQQVHEGELVDDSGNFSELKIGDLLFFGRQGTDSIPAKVVHVGMWLGNNRFIHASADIHISSVDPADSLYDAFNLNRYLYTRRIAADTNANHRLNYTQRIRDFALVH
jgi:SH3-like domain-containing protein